MKNFRWREDLRLRLSADFINAFNHVILGNPGVVLGGSDFGQITATGREARTIQLGIKFAF